MKKLMQPIHIDREIVLDPNKTIVSKIDLKGRIEYSNEDFFKISGYSEWEIMGQHCSLIRHPHMPEIFHKILWDRLLRGKNICVVTKNLAKNGRYYWVVMDFQYKYASDGRIISIYSRGKAIPEIVKRYFSKLYGKLVDVERVGGVSASGAYMQGLLKDSKISYDVFLLKIFNLTKESLMAYMRSQVSDLKLIESKNMSIKQIVKKDTQKKGFLKNFFS